MATPTYQINSGTILPGIVATWRRAVKRVNADGSIDYQPWAEHFWRIAKMSAADFEELQVLQGAVLTELKTNDADDRNNNATYTGAVIRLVDGRHQGTRVLDVNVEFRVDIS